jgi:hypothetical protein
MAGFPGRPDRAQFGPTYEDEFPVENPKRELGEAVINLNMWQLAGVGLVSPKVVITATVSGSAVTVTNQLLAWDPNQTGAAITIAYNSTGNYTPTFASTYTDEDGNNVATGLIGGTVFPNTSANINGVFNRTSGYQGVIYLFDADAGTPIDADFTLVIW